MNKRDRFGPGPLRRVYRELVMTGMLRTLLEEARCPPVNYQPDHVIPVSRDGAPAPLNYGLNKPVTAVFPRAEALPEPDVIVGD